MHLHRPGRFRLAGAFLILISLLLNPWILARLLAPDGRIESTATVALILILQLLLFLLGLSIVLFHAWYHRHWRQVLLSLCSTILGLLMIEGGLRLFDAAKYHFSPPNRSRADYYGWVTEPNLSYTREQPGFGVVRYSTQQHGFRRWGDVTADAKLLVIGDSFTQAYSVSDGETYYDRIAAQFPRLELFAYGCGGYGSLQEYMILDRHIDDIRPTLILWQFCSNDLIDNSVELESLSYFNQHQRRPYLRNGRIEWLVPHTNFGFFYNFAHSSRLLRLVINIDLESLRGRRTEWLEKDFAQEHALLAEAVETTSQIMKMARDRAGEIPFVAFSANEAPWVGEAYADICRERNIDYIPGISAAIDEKKAEGVVVDGLPIDAHWNANGHAIAGRLIADYLSANQLAGMKEAEAPSQ